MEVLYSLKDKRRGIKIPLASEKLAEETGIHIGDGYMIYQKNGYSLVYAGNLFKDKVHMQFLRSLLKDPYNIDSNVKEIRQHSLIYIRIFSKAICTFKNSILKMPFGEKYESIDIPKVFQSNPPLAKACIRGIFDTDGGVVFQKQEKYCYPAVILVTKSKFLASTLMRLLKDFGFKPYVGFDNKTSCSKIWIKGNVQFQKWFEVIGSNNERNIKKYQSWLSNFRRHDQKI